MTAAGCSGRHGEAGAPEGAGDVRRLKGTAIKSNNNDDDDKSISLSLLSSLLLAAVLLLILLCFHY